MQKVRDTLLRVWDHNVFKIFFFGCLIVLSFFLLPNETRNVLIPAIIGFFLSSLLTSLLTTYRNSIEDRVKSKQDETFIKKIYPEEKPFVVTANGISRNIYYKVIAEYPAHLLFQHKDEMFELDELFTTYYFDILKSHSNSYIKNVDTIRLVDVEQKSVVDHGSVCILHTQRTNYFDHLLTNRAVDYPIRGKASLRHIYEPGPTIRPLRESKFANQIGYNCLVILSDHTIILQKRSGNATYSKNKVTSSLTGRLPMSIHTGSTEKDLEAFIKDQAITTLGFSENLLMDHVTFKVCSITRNLYEGGKPQIYFLLKLNAFSSTDYYNLRGKDLELHEDINKLDRNVRIHITDIQSVTFVGKKDKIKMNNRFDKKKRIKVVPEKAFFVNLSYAIDFILDK